MALMNRLKSVFRGWFPHDPAVTDSSLKFVESKDSKPKPWWWTPLWVLTVIGIIVSGGVTYFVLDTTLLRTISVVIISLFVVGFAYYIRVKPSIKINRAIYIMLGITPIGFVMWIICSYVFNKMIVTSVSGTLPLFLATGTFCFGLGALIGDLVGKHRNYVLPMTP